jgi:hypothetical protein
MTSDAPPTGPGYDPPSEPHPLDAAAHRFADLVAALLEPVRSELAQLRCDLGLANGQTRSVAHRLVDLEDRVGRLELCGARTEPPGCDQ